MARLIDSIQGHNDNLQKLFESADKKTLPHAMIFSGPNGIGKKKCALALAQKLICENLNSPCGICGSCLRVEKIQSENLRVIEPDGAFIKIDQVREVLDFLSLSNFGRKRVIIFDQAHLMNPQAANTLLKTLEEPNPDVFFILIGLEPEQFMSTIRSRSHILRFTALSIEDLKKIRPQYESWSYHYSRGQVLSLEKISSEDFKIQREESLVLLEQFWQDQDFLLNQTWRDLVKNRESAQFVLQSWLTMVRDLFLIKNSELDQKSRTAQLIMNLDQRERFRRLSDISVEKMTAFCDGLLLAQKDLFSNCDSVLLFESLWVKYVARSI